MAKSVVRTFEPPLRFNQVFHLKLHFISDNIELFLKFNTQIARPRFLFHSLLLSLSLSLHLSLVKFNWTQICLLRIAMEINAKTITARQEQFLNGYHKMLNKDRQGQIAIFPSIKIKLSKVVRTILKVDVCHSIYIWSLIVQFFRFTTIPSGIRMGISWWH